MLWTNEFRQFTAILKPSGRIGLQAPLHQIGQRRRDQRTGSAKVRAKSSSFGFESANLLLLEWMAAHRNGACFALRERVTARQQVKQSDPKGINIGLLALDSVEALRSHEHFGAGKSARLLRKRRGQAEVGELRQAVGEENILRLDVSEDDGSAAVASGLMLVQESQAQTQLFQPLAH